MIQLMQLCSTLTWLVDAAAASPAADRFLAELSSRLIEDDVPLVGSALTLAVSDPIIAHRTWLWRADTAAVIEAFEFAPAELTGTGLRRPAGNAGRDWLARLGAGVVQQEAAGSETEAPLLGGIGPRRFTPAEADLLREAARFAAAPLAALSARA